METKLAYTIKETAAQLNLSPRTVEGMLRRGEVPCVRLGAKHGAVRIPHSALQEMLDSRQAVRG